MIDPSVRAVFFDAVGTLLFPAAPVHETYARHAGRYGLALDPTQVRMAIRAAFARQEAMDRATEWRTDEPRERSRWRAIVAEALPGPEADACFAGLWDWYADPIAWRAHPNAGAVLRALEADGRVVGLASNFDARLERILPAFPDLAPVAARCIISSRVGWRKPAAGFFDDVARVADVPARSILYVGDDRTNDYDGASAAGLQALLIAERPIEGVRSIRHLSDILPKLPPV